MEIKLDIPRYSQTTGLEYNWENGFEIVVKNLPNAVVISANKAGLLSLANHLLNLAQDEVPKGHHMHFDEVNSLEEGSLNLIVEKV